MGLEKAIDFYVVYVGSKQPPECCMEMCWHAFGPNASFPRKTRVFPKAKHNQGENPATEAFHFFASMAATTSFFPRRLVRCWGGKFSIRADKFFAFVFLDEQYGRFCLYKMGNMRLNFVLWCIRFRVVFFKAVSVSDWISVLWRFRYCWVTK